MAFKTIFMHYLIIGEKSRLGFDWFLYLRVSQGQNQGVSQQGLYQKFLGRVSFKLIQVVGRL